MKNFTFIIFMLLTFPAIARAQTFPGGDGTVANPYQISTKAELLQVTNYADKAFVLLNDIDFDGDGAYTASIIANFSGKFDGLGHQILNLTLEGSVSFFGTTTETGIVKNLHIRNLTFTAYLYSNGSTNAKNQYHAPFANTNNGEIENCSYEGQVTAYAYLAGFVLTNNGTIKNCYSNAIVNAYDGQNISYNRFPGRYAGGFVRANNASGIIMNCYSTGTVTVGDRGAAGFVHTNAGQISNSFAFNTSVSSTWYGSDVHRFANSSSGTLSGVYALETMTLNGSTTTSSDASSIEGADISSADITVQTTYTGLGWDFSRNWKLEAGDTYPQLRILPDCPEITLTEIISSACENSTYNKSIGASGGDGTYGFALLDGTLPSGLSLSTAGVLSGTLTTPETVSFTVSATDESGCVGTKDYSFTVFPTKTFAISESICFGSSYILGTQTLSTAGEYEETFTSVHGCDSIVTLTLTVNPVYNHTDVATICEGESFVFGTQTLSTAGEYEETFTSVHGCDSIVTLTLTVNPVYNHTDVATICEGESFAFGTRTLSTAGEYEETFTSVHGCDSIVTLTLTVNPVYNHTDVATICEGELYTFGTQTLSTDGEYEETFTSVHGCDSIVTLTLTINPVYNHTDVATICEGELYIFGTQTLTTSGEYTEVFESVSGCDSTVVLTLTVTPTYNVFETVTVYEDDLPYQFGEQSLTLEGEFVETFTAISGCDSMVTLTLVVKPEDNIPPDVVCNPIEVSLHSSGRYELDETDILAVTEGTSDNDSEYDQLLIEIKPGTFSCEHAGLEIPVLVTVTDIRGNENTCSTTVKVSDQTLPQISCRNISVILDENGQKTLSKNEFYSSASDACGIANITVSRQQFSCSHLGTNNVIVRATDNNNNFRTCTSVVTVFDNLPPLFEPVADQIAEVDTGECFATIDYPEIIALDNCDIADLFLLEGLGPNGEFPVGTTRERWVAVDASGNSDTLTFKVKISDTPAAPGLNVIPDVEVEEDADWVTVTVTGISDGSECEEYPLGFVFSVENDQLIESYQTEYLTGEDVAYLKLLPSPNATGESNATLTVTNSETGQETGIDFILRITPVNDPPFLVHPVQDMEMKAGDSLEVVFNPEKGIIFDDVDEDDILQLFVRQKDGTTLPEWLVFRNDSLLAYPAAADTGCIELLLVATDLAGEEVSSPFMLCVDFSVGTNLIAKQGIKIYPNPTTGKVYIELSGLANRRADVSVVNILGQKVLHKIYESEGRWEIDLSNQVSGMYLLKIHGNGIDFNRKIVLNREE